MRVLVVSHKHLMLPFSWRLKREEHDVQLRILKSRYAPAWTGKLDKSTEWEFSPEELQAAREGELVVLTDSKHALEQFAGSPYLYYTMDTGVWKKPPALILGAWFTGEEWQYLHWFVPDWGLWPGGLGPLVMSGATLLRGERFPEDILESLRDPLKSGSFKGLVSVGLQHVPASNTLEPTGEFQAGWLPLHSHLFLADFEEWGELLTGAEAATVSLPTYSVGLIVSQPPWPHIGNPAPQSVPIPSLTSEVTKHVLFHDIKVEDGQVWTAGTDGLVGIARGSGNSFARAKSLATLAASALVFPERQLRLDIGGAVDPTLVGLEALGYL